MVVNLVLEGEVARDGLNQVLLRQKWLFRGCHLQSELVLVLAEGPHGQPVEVDRACRYLTLLFYFQFLQIVVLFLAWLLALLVCRGCCGCSYGKGLLAKLYFFLRSFSHHWFCSNYCRVYDRLTIS